MPVITRAVGEDEPMPEAVAAAAAAPAVVATPEPAVAAKAEPIPAGPRAAADVSAGLSFTGRRFDFDENFPVGEKPNEYRGMFVPGLLVTGVVYPMMFVPKFKTSPLSDIGVTFVLDQALLLKSKDESNMLEYDTTMRRWGFGLRYRMNVSNIGLRFGAGYNNLSFLIKSGQFDPFPDTTYSYLDIGGGARIPVMDKLAILANVAYLVVFSTGEIENPEQYGSGSAMGFSVDAGAEYQIMPKLVVRASLRYQRMSFSFDGLGAKAMGAGPDMVVSGATDQYYGGSATAAYQF
jgi:opacity protein-like surface antigen